MGSWGRVMTAFLALVIWVWAPPAEADRRGRMKEKMGDMDSELTEDVFSLRFYDAVKGDPIPGATVRFEGTTGQTDASGVVRLPMPTDLGDGDDTRYGHFSCKGYVTARVPVEFKVGTLFFNRYSVSPSIPLGYVRVVLDWSAKPPDLDAHLVKDGVYRLSFRDMKKYQDLAWLDRDDMNGYGPETITVKRVDARATYHVRIHDYTHQRRRASTTLAESRAHVRVYTSKGLQHSFTVPPNGRGTVWHVLDIEKGAIRPVNRVDDKL